MIFCVLIDLKIALIAVIFDIVHQNNLKLIKMREKENCVKFASNLHQKQPKRHKIQKNCVNSIIIDKNLKTLSYDPEKNHVFFGSKIIFLEFFSKF